jgi:hypothetical protein
MHKGNLNLMIYMIMSGRSAMMITHGSKSPHNSNLKYKSNCSSIKIQRNSFVRYPFAVKDNIDVEGFHTTAACKEAAYLAHSDATVVAKLKAAGAIVIGKTNLDQFATGLVGVRSPYGRLKIVLILNISVVVQVLAHR